MEAYESLLIFLLNTVTEKVFSLQPLAENQNPPSAERAIGSGAEGTESTT